MHVRCQKFIFESDQIWTLLYKPQSFLRKLKIWAKKKKKTLLVDHV